MKGKTGKRGGGRKTVIITERKGERKQRVRRKS